MKDDIKQDKSMTKKAVGMHEKQLHGGKKSDLSKLKCGGKVAKYAGGGKVGKGAAEAPTAKDMGPLGLKKGGACKMKKFAEGGTPTSKPEKKKEAPPVPPFAKDQNQDTKNQKAYEQYQKTRKFAKGGGCELRGKTKGRFV